MSDSSCLVTVARVRGFYRSMCRIRISEDRIAELIESGEARCPCHLYVGQEAVAVGVCETLCRADYVFGGHRSHGHYLAKGGDLNAMIAEILGKTTGCAKGRGGSMHLVAPDVGILGTVPIVAATIPMAVGAAIASRLRNDGRVSVAFFGDGAVEEGTYHESMNLASARGLAVIFVCENNMYASHLALLQRRAKDNIIDSAAAHGMPGVVLDGNDIFEVSRGASEAVERARSGGGPSLLECRTYRWRGHVGPSYDVDVGVQRKDELPYWRARDPIARTAEWLRAHGVDVSELDRIRQELLREIEAAVRFARESSWPEPAQLANFVFSAAPERTS